MQRRILLSLLIGTTTLTTMGHTEENLLWKSFNTAPAAVVPAYVGQGSPFPKVSVAATETVSSSDILDEQARLKEEAFVRVQTILKSGNALLPELRNINVGGMVEGNLGPRVLINNQWLGVGGKILTRQYKTPEVQAALKMLMELDGIAGSELTQKLNEELAANPTVALTLQKITSSSLVLSGPKGPIKVNINNNSI